MKIDPEHGGEGRDGKIGAMPALLYAKWSLKLPTTSILYYE